MVAALLATSSAFVAGYQVVGSRVAEVQGSRVAARVRAAHSHVHDAQVRSCSARSASHGAP